MRAAVCDDERDVREYLGRKIAAYDRALRVEEYESGGDLLDNGADADIIFLDVQMPGMDGIVTAKRLREMGCDAVIIFVSGEKEHVFKAFDVGAFHYLVKPFDKAKFYEVLSKAMRQVREKQAISKGAGVQVIDEDEAVSGADSGKTDGETMGQDATGAEKAGRFIVVKSGRAHIRVMLDTVLFAEVTNRKVTLHTFDGDIEYYGRLSELMNLAGDDFARPHRAYLVNMRHIRSYDSENIYLVKDTVPIARGRHADFVKSYLRYNARQMRTPADG